MKKHWLILFIICLALSSCVSQEKTRHLVGSWRLTAYGPVDSTTPAVPDVGANLIFGEDGTLAGTTGCNELGGDYMVKGDQIMFVQIVSTLILCPELQMAQEEAMLRVLTETASFKIEGDMLTITKDGMVLVFEAMASAA